VTDYLPYAAHEITQTDIDAVVEVLKGDRLTQGPKVAEFEQALCEVTGANHAVAVNSGTAALHLALLAAGVGPGDQVIVPALTFAATANAVLYCGATPVMADVGEDLTIDLDCVDTLMNDDVRVVMAVDFAGLPAECRTLGAYVTEANLVGQELYLISDACHSLGACNTEYPDFTCLSFHPAKHITTAEGGAILTNDEQSANGIRALRNHGQAPYVDWERLLIATGYNYRLSDIQAALGLSQLARLDRYLDARRELWTMYDLCLAGVDGLQLPPWPEDRLHACHIYPVQLPKSADRQAVYHYMHKHGIGVQVHYKPLHQMSLYHKYVRPGQTFPNADAYYERALTLPLFPAMTANDVDRVVETLKDALGVN